MLITTTDSIETHAVTAYHGLVVGEAIMGANVFRDIFAGITDILGGRSGAYEGSFRDARKEALADVEDQCRRLGGNAVIGIDVDYEVVGGDGSMMMVSISGTAVTIVPR